MQTSVEQDALLRSLATRRSISPHRLVHPGPDAAAIGRLLQVASRAPDHGRLRPWRVVEFGAEHREPLARLFEEEKLRRDPLASDEDRVRARQHALSPPVLLAFVVSPQLRSDVPQREQWLAAGAALGNLMNAAHAMGFGAIALSGDRCYDVVLADALGVARHEAIGAFVSIGTVAKPPPAAYESPVHEVWSRWHPARPDAATAGDANPEIGTAPRPD